jgi:hypothetical protein
MAVKYGLSEHVKGDWRHASCGSCGVKEVRSTEVTNGNEEIGQTNIHRRKKNWPLHLQRMIPERAHEHCDIINI